MVLTARTIPTQGGDSGTWGTELNEFIEGGLSYLGHQTVDLQNGDSKTTVYTVPTGKVAYILAVLISGPSGSLAGGTDFDIGSGASANSWLLNVDLSGMTATTDYRFLFTTGIFTAEVADATFGIIPVTGATGDVTATMTVFGMVVDA